MSDKKLRQIAMAINDATRCRHCGGSKLTLAIEHRGHGTGVSGSSQHEATAYEALSIQKHCTCPDGPMWSHFIKCEWGKALKLEEAQARYPDLSKGRVAFWDPASEQFCSISAGKWNEFIKALASAAEGGDQC